jgi:hypothetical protein
MDIERESKTNTKIINQPKKEKKINIKKQLGKKKSKRTNEKNRNGDKNRDRDKNSNSNRNRNRNRKKESENIFNYKKIYKCFHYLMNINFEDEKINKGNKQLGKLRLNF